ncbi:TetR-like C-terminal domain-containing protein, partial [Streptomyces sp. NPDC059374]|uniref:TetR-like C-terminal domain-containing protein n=1 Tax=Streptomyces sp. NPDC059374 TaxID=3346814 RepID=UPI0036C0261D
APPPGCHTTICHLVWPTPPGVSHHPAGGVPGGAHHGTARARIAALGRVYLEFALGDRGMYELMFRHDLLESGRLGLRDTSLPLFGRFVELVEQVRPDVDPRLVAGALWANLHGIAQLWSWGSLQLVTATADFKPLLDAALDAHLGPEER